MKKPALRGGLVKMKWAGEISGPCVDCLKNYLIHSAVSTVIFLFMKKSCK